MDRVIVSTNINNVKQRILEFFLGKKKPETSFYSKNIEFPVVLTIKYIHPIQKTNKEICSDFGSWGNKSISVPILKKYENLLLVSVRSEFNHYQGYSETLLYFKDEKSCHDFCSEMGSSGAVNQERQRQLGYQVIRTITNKLNSSGILA